MFVFWCLWLYVNNPPSLQTLAVCPTLTAVWTGCRRTWGRSQFLCPSGTCWISTQTSLLYVSFSADYATMIIRRYLSLPSIDNLLVSSPSSCQPWRFSLQNRQQSWWCCLFLVFQGKMSSSTQCLTTWPSHQRRGDSLSSCTTSSGSLKR